MVPTNGTDIAEIHTGDVRGLVTFWKRCRDLQTAETEADVCRTVVDIATDLPYVTDVTVYVFDDEDGLLRPAATSVLPGAIDAVSSKSDPIWDTFSGETARHFDGDGSDDDREHDSGELEEVASIAVPLDENGVLCVHVDGNRVEETTVELVETLGDVMGNVLSRVRTEMSLRERIDDLDTQTDELERTGDEFEIFRRTVRSLSDADSRSALETRVCEQLNAWDEVGFVWMGTFDRSGQQIVPRAHAGVEKGYLERYPTDVGEGTEPAVRALRTGETTIVNNIASELHAERWQLSAFEREFRSAIAVPLSYDGVVSGVLTVFSETPAAFEGTTRDVITELGTLVGNAIASIERRNALSTDRSMELDLEVTDPTCFFVRFVRRTGHRLSFEGMAPRDDGTTLVLLTADEPQTLLERARETPSIKSVRSFDAGGNVFVEIRLTDPFIGSTLASHGIKLERVTATPEEVQITVSIPPTMPPRYAMDAVLAEYPGSSLLAKRERNWEQGAALKGPSKTIERLTDRRREILELAYDRGYFEQPKNVTGVELSDELDISPSAFHQQLRAAESDLLSWLFDERDESNAGPAAGNGRALGDDGSET